MLNLVAVSGEIKKLSVNQPKNSQKNASAVILLQYGVERETTGNAVEFVNAALIRVPSYKYPQLQGKLKEGQRVSVVGHLQGVWKNNLDQGYLTVELVADRIDVESEPGHAASPAAAGDEAEAAE